MSQGAYRELPPEARVAELEIENERLRKMLRVYAENDLLRRELASRNRIHCVDCRHVAGGMGGWKCSAFPVEVWASERNKNLDCVYFQPSR